MKTALTLLSLLLFGFSALAFLTPGQVKKLVWTSVGQDVPYRIKSGGTTNLGALKWLDKDRGSILRDLAQEREQRIKVLEARSLACEADRLTLHGEIATMRSKHDELQVEIRGIMSSMLRHSNSGACGTECMKDFEERWQQKCEALGYDDEITAHEEHRLPMRTTRAIQAEAMTPDSLAVKRRTAGILGGTTNAKD